MTSSVFVLCARTSATLTVSRFHCAALQCTNQPPDFGGGLYQPVTVLYADKPYVIATEQDGIHPTAFGVVGTGWLFSWYIILEHSHRTAVHMVQM
jgi:hypothetical protein